MTLGLKKGRFWRGAKLTCINLLLVYDEGCQANCGYCGLAHTRKTEDPSFIRVDWPTYEVAHIIDRMKNNPDAHRVCISMITRKRAMEDTVAIAKQIRAHCDVPISALISPTILQRPDLEAIKAAGVDKVGIAFDAATSGLFDKMRGTGAKGPHKWDRYWQCFEDAVAVFGGGQASSHFIVGLGETEEEMVRAFWRVHELGGLNHLFSFYPEAGTCLEKHVPPPMEQYRRVQLAAQIVDEGLTTLSDFSFDATTGRIEGFGISKEDLDCLINDGDAFRTRGCTGRDGCVACNRPFANSAPGEGLRNYPFALEADDVALIRKQLDGDWMEPVPVMPAGRKVKGIHKNPRKKGRIHFYAPNIKHFDTDEFANSGKPSFVPVSITGEACSLDCKYCEGELLKGMYSARTGEELIALARQLADQGCEGMLVSGGCDMEGIVQLGPFRDALDVIKKELGFKTAIHTKMMDEDLAKDLSGIGLDVVMIDVVGADETLAEIYNMPDKTIAHVEETIELAEKYGLALAPHIVLGAHNGEFRGEWRALKMLRGRTLAALVVVMLMPLNGRHRGVIVDPDVKEIRRFFKTARMWFPDVSLLLGCARPMGKIQKEIDIAALEAGVDGIAYPSDDVVVRARQMGLRPVFSEYCCALSI